MSKLSPALYAQQADEDFPGSRKMSPAPVGQSPTERLYAALSLPAPTGYAAYVIPDPDYAKVSLTSDDIFRKHYAQDRVIVRRT